MDLISRESNRKHALSNPKKEEFKIEINSDMTSKVASIRDDPSLFSNKSISAEVCLPPKVRRDQTETLSKNVVKNEILEEEEEEEN